MLTGQIEFYDDASAWGLIRSDDGRLYDLRGAQLGGLPPRVGDRVGFDSQAAPGAPRATNVRRLKPSPAEPEPSASRARPARASDPRSAHPPAGPRVG